MAILSYAVMLYMPALFWRLSGPLESLRPPRQIGSAAESSALETKMRSRFSVRHRSAKRPDLVFAALIVFVILLIGLVRAIDVLAAHAGGAIG